MNLPHNRIALVTGAGSGVGRATALALLADGWRVVFSGRRLDALRESIALAGDPFGDIGQRALAAPADVTRADSVEMLFDFIRARFGRLDLLFNNAAVQVAAVPLEDLALAQWRVAVDTHLTGAFLCTQQAFRLMKNQAPKGGRIVNKGVAAAPEPRPQSVAGTTAAHAITGLTQAAALEGRAHGIAVGQVDIGHAGSPVDPPVDARHVAGAVLQMANLPLDTNVMFMSIMASQMPAVGRG
jgi:NAD(P)-dependent dehydrogenase (short-subunit alcohol dehydrogenase family)